jgi:adenosine deaminase
MNILLCTLGASWAVIPEVLGLLDPELSLYAHHPQRQGIAKLQAEHQLRPPDEIWVCTTEGAQTDASLADLLAWAGLVDMARHLRIWRAQGSDQLATQAECEHFRELAFRLSLKASEACQGGQLLLSLAGGRKTMSADLQRAASLFGCHRLLHVVDSGQLPQALFRPKPEDLIGPIPLELMVDAQGKPQITPLIVGAGLRHEILDVDPAIGAAAYPLPLAEPNGHGADSTTPEHETSLSRFGTRQPRSPDAAQRNPGLPLDRATPAPLRLRASARSSQDEGQIPVLFHSKPNQALSWPLPQGDLLFRQIDRREQESGRLLGNFLARIGENERHENWRQLYRLPTGTINQLRHSPLDRPWLEALPKVDLHRHLGGCLDLAEQRRVAEAVWQAMDKTQRRQALQRLQPLLHQAEWGQAEWDWRWPQRLQAGPREAAQRRSERAAALLLHASDAQLRHNLWGVTEPRHGLIQQPRGFAAYERPGELTGSAILQHPAAIEPYAQAIVEQAQREGLAYLELRGSPQKYLAGDGVGFLRRLQQALDMALNQTPEQTLNQQGMRPIIRFIVIVDRRAPADAIQQSVALAVAEQERGFVVGLDLAGDEAHEDNYDLGQMERWFAPAFAACLPISIHAGEGQPPERIWKAAYHLHADRIGHGLSLLQNPRLMQKFRDRGICLELCPSSNREVVGYQDPQYPATQSLPAYPLKALWQAGLALCPCTDNPGISRTDISAEYLAASRMSGGLSRWEALAMLKQGFSHAFLTSEQREQLLKRLDHRLYQLLLP